MGSSLLTLIGQAQAELGLFPVTPIVMGSQDDTVQQLLALANRVGGDVFTAKEDYWTALQTEWVVNVVPPVSVTGNVTQGSTTISGVVGSLAGVGTSSIVQGPGIPQSSRVVSVDSIGGNIVMELQATASNPGAAVTLTQDTYQVPADFAGYVNDTMWDRTMHWRMLGPVSPQGDQLLRSGLVAHGPRRRWRQIGRGQTIFRIFPPPSTTDTPASLVFEYGSSYWVTASDGVTGKPAFTADTDTCVFPDDLMVAGIKWRMWATKGFDYGVHKADYDAFLYRDMAMDGGRATLNMGRRRYTDGILNYWNIPDSGYGPGLFTLGQSYLGGSDVLG